MLSIHEIMRRIRVKIHDEEQITYDDSEIIESINLGLRFIRRIIADIQPELLINEHRGILESGENEIELDRIPLQVVSMTVGDELKKVKTWRTNKNVYNNKNKIYKNLDLIYSVHIDKIFKERQIRMTNLQHLSEFDKTGKPTTFFRIGSRKIRVYPIPEKETGYTLSTIDDLTEIGMNDVSPLLTDYDDFLIEYATIRLPIENEFDVSQEQQIFANIANQITQSLYPAPAGLQLKGYW